MAGTIVVTSGKRDQSDKMTELLITWVGDASNGSVPTMLIAGYMGQWITRVTTKPGSPSPTALYDITAISPDGDDLFEGDCLDRSATLPESVTMAVQIPASGFTLTIANQSVNSATGTIRLTMNGG